MSKHAIKTWTWYGVWAAVYAVIGLFIVSGPFAGLTLMSLWLLAQVGETLGWSVATPDVLETVLHVDLFVFLTSAVLTLPLVFIAIIYSGWAELDEDQEDKPEQSA